MKSPSSAPLSHPHSGAEGMQEVCRANGGTVLHTSTQGHVPGVQGGASAAPQHSPTGPSYSLGRKLSGGARHRTPLARDGGPGSSSQGSAPRA